MLNTADILETINMIREENLDIRTITMGISLLDCVSEDENRLCEKIYDKITKKAENLVKTGCEIEKDYGIPIVNKRVSVTPISLVGGNISPEGYYKVAQTLERAARTVGINFIGGFSALVQKGMTKGAENMMSIIPEALADTNIVCSSINVASTKAGINMDAVARMGEIIKKTAFKITRVGQLAAFEASRRLDVPFGIVDLSLAPTPAIGDSVAHILENMGLESCGAHGTTAALAMLNDAVKKGGVMASSHVGGLSGAFIPVSEDRGMIDAVANGHLTIEKLEAMTAVCSVGLDMIAVPGDTPAEVLSALIADEIAIGVVNTKTTAVRVIPAYGKTIGDTVDFGGLLGYSPIVKLNTCSPAKFIARGGRIPAPIHSLKN